MADKKEIVRFLMEQFFVSENSSLQASLKEARSHIREYKKLIQLMNLQIENYANIVSQRNQHIDRLQRHINFLYRSHRRSMGRVLIQQDGTISLYRRNQDGVYVQGDDEDTETEEVPDSEPESEPAQDIARRLGFETDSDEEEHNTNLIDRLLYDTP